MSDIQQDPTQAQRATNEAGRAARKAVGLAKAEEQRLWAVAQLKGRGWTRSMIDRLLGEPDELRANPCYRSAAPMRLYRAERVEAAEASAEYGAIKAVAARRSAASAAAAAKRADALMDEAYEFEPTVPKMPIGTLVDRACEAYRTLQLERGRDGWAGPNHEPQFLARICGNYLRHERSEYEQRLYVQRGKPGVAEAYEIVRKAVDAEIARVYPDLERQIAEWQALAAGTEGAATAAAGQDIQSSPQPASSD